LNDNEESRDKEYNPEPDHSGFIENKHKEANQNKWIQPYNIQVPSHLLVIGKKIKEDHQYCQN
jgi:hypothetical protein